MKIVAHFINTFPPGAFVSNADYFIVDHPELGAFLPR